VESNTGAKIIKLYSETSKLRTESQLRFALSVKYFSKASRESL